MFLYFTRKKSQQQWRETQWNLNNCQHEIKNIAYAVLHRRQVLVHMGAVLRGSLLFYIFIATLL